MQITYQELLEVVQEYSDSDGVDCFSSSNKRFAYRALERMFHRKKHDSLVSLTMCANKGCVTLPEYIDHIVQVKINDRVVEPFSYWYEFNRNYNYDRHNKNVPHIKHLPDKYYTQYDAPFSEFIPVVRAAGREDKNSYIRIHGVNKNMKQIWNKFEPGEKIVGKDGLRKGIYTVGDIPIAKITGIEKSPTLDYLELYAMCPHTRETVFLSCYNPREEHPCYKRVQIVGCPTDCLTKIDALARLKILPEYHCKELICIQGWDVLETVLEEIRTQKDLNMSQSNALEAKADRLIKNENDYKYNGSDTFEIVDLYNTEDYWDIW